MARLKLNQSGLGLLVLCMPLLGYWIYAPGLSSGFFFDDMPNLVGLSFVSDFNSALAFISEPKGGPLGRPLSLISFLINRHSWDTAPEDFLFTNIAIHLLNAVLLLWCLYRGARLIGRNETESGGFAIAVSALWMLQPQLVSATLMVVQRMTTLAATFAFLGILAFIQGLALARAGRVRAAYAWMTGGVVLGTLLGMLTKENGVLLPLFVLILQGTVLRETVSSLGAGYRRWRWIFLVLPSLAIFGYLLYLLPGMPNAYFTREFTFEQRLLTEPRIVLHYLGLILFPRRAAIGPFQEDFPLSHGLLEPVSTLLALGTIAGLLVAAVWSRRRMPVFAFAIFWFFAGHIVESTWIPLELYFEHRNYLPAVGPLVGIVALAFHPQINRRLGFALLGVYFVIVTWVCFSATSVFGNRHEAAMLWQQAHPDSVRANQFLALAHAERRDYVAAERTIHEYSDRHPKDLGLALQSVQLACVTGTAQQRSSEIQQRENLFKAGKLNSVVCNAMEKLAHLVIDDSCPGFSSEDFVTLAKLSLTNERVPSMREVGYCLNDTMAMVYFNERDFSGTMEHLEAAFTYRYYWSLAQRVIEMPISAGRLDLARENIEIVRKKMPTNPFAAKSWEAGLEGYEKLISRIENDQRQQK